MSTSEKATGQQQDNPGKKKTNKIGLVLSLVGCGVLSAMPSLRHLGLLPRFALYFIVFFLPLLAGEAIRKLFAPTADTNS